MGRRQPSESMLPPQAFPLPVGSFPRPNGTSGGSELGGAVREPADSEVCVFLLI